VEQVGAREQVQYAGLGWRFAAIAVDTMVLFFLLVVIFAVLAAAGALDLKDPAFSGGIDLRRTAPLWMYAVTYGLIFVYYTLLEALTAASVGKLVFRMRVTMDDGARPSGGAVLVRNLIRLPEVLFWYIPSGISCLTNAKNKRLATSRRRRWSYGAGGRRSGMPPPRRRSLCPASRRASRPRPQHPHRRTQRRRHRRPARAKLWPGSRRRRSPCAARISTT